MVACHFYNVPTQTGKPAKWGGISQLGKNWGILKRLEKSRKIVENTGKAREFQTNVFIIFCDIQMNCMLFAKMDQVFS